MEEKKRRLFIAINLPYEPKGVVREWQKGVGDLPVRWTKPENLHLTLLFIGWVSSGDVQKIEHCVRILAESRRAPKLRFSHIDYGPPEGPPRMFWLRGDFSEELQALRDDLGQALLRTDISFEQDSRKLTPHITTGRMRADEWRKKIGKKKPEVGISLSFSFVPRTLDLMESHLQKGGAEYEIVSSSPFGLAKQL